MASKTTLTNAIQSGRYITGYHAALIYVMKNLAQIVIITNDIPKNKRDLLKNHCELSDIPFIEYHRSAFELGQTCGLKDEVNVLCLLGNYNSEEKETNLVTQIESSLIKKDDENNIETSNEEFIPQFVLIMSDSGVSIYKKEFTQKDSMDDQLIGGFLTALYKFGNEAFSSHQTIDEIQIGNLRIQLQSYGSLLFCVGFKGQSKFAQKKTDMFIKSLKQLNAIWSDLIVASNHGIFYPTTTKKIINDLSDEIFLSPFFEWTKLYC